MSNPDLRGFPNVLLIGSEAIPVQFGERFLRRPIGRLIPWRLCRDRRIRAVPGDSLDLGLAGVLTARVRKLASNAGVDRGEILRYRGFGEKL
jgi:hypothetical protein